LILSDLLRKPVRDHSGHRLGTAIDVRFEVERSSSGEPGVARMVGLIVSHHTASSFRGYERTGVESPWPISTLLERRHRGSFLVTWDDIEVISDTAIRLRTGFHRHPSSLPTEDSP
jgi:sporulation protein YlmC with PRC-barrel domain